MSSIGDQKFDVISDLEKFEKIPLIIRQFGSKFNIYVLIDWHCADYFFGSKLCLLICDGVACDYHNWLLIIGFILYHL
ncbi:hypothetical protein BpHYR1_048169 [Brachionus plicatilis]|uniref:Uncharacterized protein n=1 Tax=Brachionus plicatilis TaxID=10195 RepID=A0A3M7QGN2_BRAPC|nr:hypothetical protein BpHYR1_048169 [Brachionus plicatilis]